MIKFKDFIKKSKKSVDTDKKTDLKRLKKKEMIPSGTVAPDNAKPIVLMFYAYF